ncbi:hypothetical protein BC832DRAFT_185966 [Gaertneriomyces semiglobifer]|nr:hypothetical protein BC832DRAFT_185966 [Gaertneriomyces semiglobifer]
MLQDARIITTAYDLDSQDMASIEEFILAAKGGLPAIRLHLARDTYNYIANSCNNTTKFLETARKLFHPSGHPRVQSGETDAGRLLQEFRTYWSGYGAKDDENIELIEWEYYFAGVSAGVDSDEWFAKMVQGCWPGMMQVKETERRKTLPALKAQGIQPQVAEKLKLASRIRRLSALVNDPRRFRTGLDVCLIRKPSSAESMYSRPFLRDLVSELYSLVGYSSSSTAEEEQIFEGIYRRVLKEAGIQGKDLLSGTPAGRPRQEGVTGLELYLRTALKRECSFLEYMLFAKTAV